MKTAVVFLLGLFLWTPFAEALLVVGDSGTDSVYTNASGAGAGWAYVGNLIGGAPSSVSYVSNGWFVTAQHVWDSDVVGKNEGTLSLGGTAYTINTETYTRITDSEGTAADLCMFRVETLAGLPTGMAVSESTPQWNDSLILIGNGLDNDGHTGLTWGTGTPYYVGSGQNRHTELLTADTTESYLSVYDSGTTSSAYAQTYDSGGGVFVNGQLTGIMTSIGTCDGEQITVVADFSTYGEQINAISPIPEPSAGILLAGIALVFGVIKRTRYRIS